MMVLTHLPIKVTCNCESHTKTTIEISYDDKIEYFAVACPNCIEIIKNSQYIKILSHPQTGESEL